MNEVQVSKCFLSCWCFANSSWVWYIMVQHRIIQKHWWENWKWWWNMKSYQQNDLVPYLQWSIFEIPSNSFGPGSGTADQISLRLRLPNEVIPTGNHVAVICHNLSQILDIPDGILSFIHYDVGSTILIFGVPEVHIPSLQSIIREYFTLCISKRTYF